MPGKTRQNAAVAVTVRRVYEPPGPGDGLRLLVDRLWPRGIAKDRLALDRWARELAPTTALRTWYGHDPARFDEFRSRYRAELDAGPVASEIAQLRERARREPVTLLTATKDVARSGAAVLAEVLRGA